MLGVPLVFLADIIVISPMAQLCPRPLLKVIEREDVGHGDRKFGIMYIAAIGDTLKSFKEESAGGGHLRSM